MWVRSGASQIRRSYHGKKEAGRWMIIDSTSKIVTTKMQLCESVIQKKRRYLQKIGVGFWLQLYEVVTKLAVWIFFFFLLRMNWGVNVKSNLYWHSLIPWVALGHSLSVKSVKTSIRGQFDLSLWVALLCKCKDANIWGSVWIAVCRCQKAFHKKNNDFVQ